MKIQIIRFLSLMLAIIPISAGAQNSIKSAFDAIIKCPEAKIDENTSLDKDPTTGKKTGQREIYSFELPASKEKLIKDVYSAFENDEEKAYNTSRGNYKNVNGEHSFAVGDGSREIVLNNPDSEYVSSLFLAPQSEDPDGIYRYAYAMVYKEKDGKFVGRLVITYATTLKHRQELERKKQAEVLRKWQFDNKNWPFDTDDNDETYDNNGSNQKTWFDEIMSYLQGMSSTGPETRIALASKIYKVIRDTPKYSDVKDADKETVREILKGMTVDKEYSETVFNRLLNQCLASIK